MDHKFSSKMTYKVCYIGFIILLIVSLICSIAAPIFLVFAVVNAVFAYKMRCIIKDYDNEKAIFDKKKMKEEKIKARADASQTVICPKCGSISVGLQARKLSVGRAVAGNLVAGPLGGAVGALTSKQNYCVCLKCGYKWKI